MASSALANNQPCLYSAVYTVDTKENWRQIAKDMETIVGNKPIGIYKEYMAEPFLYYYHGRLGL